MGFDALAQEKVTFLLVWERNIRICRLKVFRCFSFLKVCKCLIYVSG